MRLRSNPMQYDTIRYDTIRYDTIRYDTIRYDTIRYNTMRHNATYERLWPYCDATAVALLRQIGEASLAVARKLEYEVKRRS
jgi:hypothetical protein